MGDVCFFSWGSRGPDLRRSSTCSPSNWWCSLVEQIAPTAASKRWRRNQVSQCVTSSTFKWHSPVISVPFLVLSLKHFGLSKTQSLQNVRPCCFFSAGEGCRVLSSEGDHGKVGRWSTLTAGLAEVSRVEPRIPSHPAFSA